MRDTAHGCRYRPDLGLIRAAFNGHGRGMWAAYIAEVCARCLRFARRNTQIACGLRTPFLDYFVVPPSIQRPRTSAPQARRGRSDAVRVEEYGDVSCVQLKAVR